MICDCEKCWHELNEACYIQDVFGWSLAIDPYVDKMKDKKHIHIIMMDEFGEIGVDMEEDN